MYPLLIKIGSVPIHTYGVMIALGFLGGALINRWLAKKIGIDPTFMIDTTFWGMMVGLIGARFVFVLTRLPYFFADPMSIFRVWEGGLVFYGGPIAVVIWGAWYLPKHRVNFWKFADCAIHGLVFGHILGRFGCISAGCCYGRPTGAEWGIRSYAELVEPQLRGIPLHPVQLYEAVALMILLAGLLWVFHRKVFDGQVLLTYAVVYPIIRSIVEIFRGDIIRGYVIDGVLSTSQFISVLVFIAASITLYLRLRQVRRLQQGAPA